MKKVLVIASVMIAIFLAGCQQRTEFDACMEYAAKYRVYGEDPGYKHWSTCLSAGGR